MLSHQFTADERENKSIFMIVRIFIGTVIFVVYPVIEDPIVNGALRKF